MMQMHCEEGITPRMLSIEEAKKMFVYLFYLVGNADNDVEMDRIECVDVNLLDPISMQRLHIPCRGISCKHLQCFDYSTYQQFNSNVQKHRQRRSPQ